MVVSFKELEQSGCHTSGLHGLSNLRRGQGSTAPVHPQTWQVRHRRARHESCFLVILKCWIRGIGSECCPLYTVGLRLSSSLSATSSGWAALGWASGLSATWRLMGTSCRPSPITNHSSKPSLMDTERDCESRYNTVSMHQFIHFSLYMPLGSSDSHNDSRIALFI